ncbi:MAG: hypothetical protein ACYDD1_20305 [Caulobacteraceae bacterium]
MTPPDAQEPPPTEPATDTAPEAFGPLVGPVYWVLIAVSIACIVAAAVIGLAGPKLFPVRASPHPHAIPWQAGPRPLNSAARPDQDRPPALGRRAELGYALATRPL